MKLPLLSVVIPTWNRQRLVCDAIDSALAQAVGSVEVIVVDDGSTDDTCSVLAKRFGSRISLLRMRRRAGAGAARNAGARLAKGELLAFLDSDDLWLPGKLDAEISVLERLPAAEAIISDNLFFDEGQLKGPSRFTTNGLLAATQGRVCWMSECPTTWTNCSIVSTCSMTLRRNTVARLGEPLYAEGLAAHEDWELEVRIFQMCRVAVLPKVWSHVRQFDDGTRPDRPTPGKPRTPAQQIKFLRGRIEVLERSLRLSGLASNIVSELEASRADTAEQIALCEGG